VGKAAANPQLKYGHFSKESYDGLFAYNTQEEKKSSGKSRVKKEKV